MRRRDAWLLALATALVAAGCSRLTFVKPDPKRRGFDQVAPEYHVQEDKAAKQRLMARERLGLAEQQYRAGNYAVAADEARKVLKADPSSADAYTLLGLVADVQGQAQEAGRHFRKAAELAPSRGTVLNNYGAWLCANGQPAEGLVWIDRALADPSYPTPAAALANAGGCARKAGQYERADRDLRRALQMDANNAYALAEMAENEYRNGRFFEARAFCERRLGAAPADRRTLELAAMIEEKLGDTDAARRYRQRLEREFPGATTAVSGNRP